jgi:hypothetical protein
MGQICLGINGLVRKILHSRELSHCYCFVKEPLRGEYGFTLGN